MYVVLQYDSDLVGLHYAWQQPSTEVGGLYHGLKYFKPTTLKISSRGEEAVQM